VTASIPFSSPFLIMRLSSTALSILLATSRTLALGSKNLQRRTIAISSLATASSGRHFPFESSVVSSSRSNLRLFHSIRKNYNIPFDRNLFSKPFAYGYDAGAKMVDLERDLYRDIRRKKEFDNLPIVDGNKIGEKTLIIDEINDTGNTLSKINRECIVGIRYF
jgi:hypothetical protein